VVDRTKVKFGKLFSPNNSIQKVIHDNNKKFILDVNFFQGMKIRTYVPSAFLLEDHENEGILGDGTRMNNTHFYKFLDNVLNLIF
jgi:glycerol-3-phosphate responsive antiterminator